MQNLSPEFNAIQAYFVRGSSMTPFTDTWQKIHEEKGYGSANFRVGGIRHISFSQYHQNLMRDWMIEETGIDPEDPAQIAKYQPQIEAERKAELQRRTRKVPKHRPYGEMIKVARADASAINTMTGNAVIPPRCHLEVEFNSLRIDGEIVLFVGDGDVIREWNICKMPPELSSALIIHKELQEDPPKVIDPFTKQKPLLNVGFYDFDPKGLSIALDNGHDALLLPADITTWVKNDYEFEKINRPSRFDHQHEELVSARVRAKREVADMVKHMEREKIAVRQIDMIHEKIPLKLVSIRR